MIQQAFRFAARAAWNKYRQCPWVWAADAAIAVTLTVLIILNT